MSEPNLDRWAREVEEQSKGSIWKGLGVTLLFHAIAMGILFFILAVVVNSEEGLMWVVYPMMYMGLTQLVYMIPAILIFRSRGATEIAKGLIVGASMTFLLNATCNGFLFLNR